MHPLVTYLTQSECAPSISGLLFAALLRQLTF